MCLAGSGHHLWGMEKTTRGVERAWCISVLPGAIFLWGARGNVGIRYLRVFGLLFIHMFSPLVRLLRWCVSRSCCVVYFPLSCAQLISLSLVAHVAVYCVPLSVSLYLLVTVALCISVLFVCVRH